MKIISVVVHDNLLEVFGEEKPNSKNVLHMTMSFETLMQLIELGEMFNSLVERHYAKA